MNTKAKTPIKEYEYDEFKQRYKPCSVVGGLISSGDINQIEYIEPKLKGLLDIPKKLYIAGDIKEIDQICVSIVGSRKITDYGRQVTSYIVKTLSSYEVTIVSGLMYGVDIAAHRLAISNGLRTIGILGYGLNHLNHFGYSREVVSKIFLEKRGAIISEFDHDDPPAKWTFPQRNRIIAALADVVIVVEADENSGSLITAGLAAEIGREVFAVPGSIFSRRSRGTNKLIKEGACLLSHPEEIVEFFGKKLNKKDETSTFAVKLSENEQKIYNCLKKSKEEGKLKVWKEELFKSAGLSFADFNNSLINIEMRGLINVSEGGVSLKGSSHRRTL